MFDGIKALVNSEKALAGGTLIVGATVLVILGEMTVVDWQDYTKWIFYGYIGGKTVQGAVSSVVNRKAAPTEAPKDEAP